MSRTASFLQIKQTEVEGLWYYLPVFYTHVYTAIFVLIAGSFQFNKMLQRQFKTLHRRLGYVYVFLILSFAAPSGLVMGIHSNGGWIAQFFFITLSLLWWWYTLQALLNARRKNFAAHRNYMIRSFALTLSAITLRIWKVVIVNAFHLAPMDTYMIIAGLGWIPNLLVAEYITLNSKSLFTIFTKNLPK